MKLILVESPTKVRLISSFLPSGEFEVASTYGHIKQIPSASKQVFIEKDKVESNWESRIYFKKLLKSLDGRLGSFESLIIATDPDREGERIALDLYEEFRDRIDIKRVTFNSITKEAVSKGISNPREVDFKLGLAAKARCILDYWIGFNVSPLMWKLNSRAKSMGRVQAPSLNWVVEREVDNLNRTPKDKVKFEIQSSNLNFKFYSEEDLETSFRKIKRSLNKMEVRVKTSRFKGPKIEVFNTYEIQKFFNSRYKINSKQLMSILQDLYAGRISEAQGEGLITYMRTDSKSYSKDFIDKVLVYLLRSPFKEAIDWARIKNSLAQKKDVGAHEAIRPSKLNFKTWEDISSKIYREILLNSIATFLKPSEYLGSWVELGPLKSQIFYSLERMGSNELARRNAFNLKQEFPKDMDLKFSSFNLSLKQEHGWKILSEGRLIQAMKEIGVGRPSTWNQMLPNLQQRFYASSLKNSLKSEHLGYLVNAFMKLNLPAFTDGNFTSNLENILEDIAEGRRSYERALYTMCKDLQDVLMDISWDKEKNSYIDLLKSSIALKRRCCGREMSLRVSLKKGIFFFFFCESCGGVLPLNYRFLRRQGKSKIYITSHARIVSIEDSLPGQSYLAHKKEPAS